MSHPIDAFAWQEWAGLRARPLSQASSKHAPLRVDGDCSSPICLPDTGADHGQPSCCEDTCFSSGPPWSRRPAVTIWGSLQPSGYSACSSQSLWALVTAGFQSNDAPRHLGWSCRAVPGNTIMNIRPFCLAACIWISFLYVENFPPSRVLSPSVNGKHHIACQARAMILPFFPQDVESMYSLNLCLATQRPFGQWDICGSDGAGARKVVRHWGLLSLGTLWFPHEEVWTSFLEIKRPQGVGFCPNYPREGLGREP